MVAEPYAELQAARARQEDLRRLVLSLIQRRWLIAGIVAASIVTAAIISFVMSPVYLAQTTLVPADTGEAPSAIASALGQFGGLAELAGLQGPQDRTIIEAIELLKSRKFTEDFIQDENLLPVLFYNRWNPQLKRWRAGARVPDLWDGYREFDRKVRFVDQDQKTGVVTVRIEWKDPSQAADWANELVRRVNAQMQQRTLVETQTTLDYLKRQLLATRVASVQVALQNLIEENLKREAIASVRADYVFRVVDPAAPPNLRDKLRPHKVLYVITGAIFGLLLALLAVMAIDARRNMAGWLADRNPGE